MKKTYSAPSLEWIVLMNQDVLTLSTGDNDVAFSKPKGDELIDMGWGKYY